MSPDPFLQIAHLCPSAGQSEVSPPAPHIPIPVVTQLLTGATSSAVPQFPNFRFESFHTLRCYSDPLLAIQSKAQELSFPDPPRSALSGVHLQSQTFLDPALYRTQRSLCRRLTAYVDIA